MFACAFEACRALKQFGFADTGSRDDFRYPRLALGKRAGFVNQQRVNLLHAFERFGVLDQDPLLGAATNADHDRHWRRESQRARAGDDQHGHRRDESIDEGGLGAEGRPGGEREDSDRDQQWHEPGGHLVGEPLDRCARALRGRDHLHDLRQQRIAADFLRAHDKRAALIQRAGDDLGAPRLHDGHRLAGHHRLVEVRAAFGHLAVDRHLFAWAHAQEIARLYSVEWHFFVAGAYVKP